MQMTVTSASVRAFATFRNARGDYHRGRKLKPVYHNRKLSKALRVVDKAVIAEHLDTTEVPEPDFRWVLCNPYGVIGVYSDYSEVLEAVRSFDRYDGDFALDWDYVDITGDSNMAYEARWYLDRPW